MPVQPRMNNLRVDQIAAMNPHDLHMFIGVMQEELNNMQPRVSLPVYIGDIATPFKMEKELYREGTDESRYRLYQLIQDLEAFARFMGHIGAAETVGYPANDGERITYRICPRENNAS